MVELIDFSTHLYEYIDLSWFGEKCKLGVVGFDDCAHALNTLSLISVMAGCKYATYAESDILELDRIVLVDGPVIKHLN